jgi:hypothetical protein
MRITLLPAVFGLATVALASAGVPPGTGAADPEDEARVAAQAWLALMDGNDYRAAWREAAIIFQQARTADAWAREAAAIRTRVGSIECRELATIRPATDPPAVPPGEYMRLRFECEFTAAGTVREIMLMVEEPGRGWRVVSYVVESPDG